MSIEFKGLEEIFDKLESLDDTENVEAALNKACALVERSAKENAPKGTGELRRSITSKVQGLVGEVFTPLEYAPYVEYGTGLFVDPESGKSGRTDVPWYFQDEETGDWISTCGMKPQPYMRPALNENRERIIKLIQEGLLQ